jgi:hypothetical protein
MPHRVGLKLSTLSLVVLGAVALWPGVSLAGSPNIVINPPHITSDSSTTFVAGSAGTFGKDKLSHLASCRLNKSTHGDQTKITATAKDKAGNIRRATLTYFVV